MVAHRVGTAIRIAWSLRSLDRQFPYHLIGLANLTAAKIWKRYSNTLLKLDRAEGPLARVVGKMIVYAAFLITWQRRELANRRKELNLLYNKYRRMKMKVLCSKIMDENDKEFWINELRLLLKDFKKSEFFKTIQIPKNNER